MGIASIYRYNAGDNALDPFNLHNQRVIFTSIPEPPPPPPDPQPGAKLLFVAESTTLPTGHAALRDMLISANWDVTVRSWFDAIDYNDIAVVVIVWAPTSDTNRYLHPPVGLVAMDSWRGVGMGTGLQWQNLVTDVEVTNPSSSVAAGVTGVFPAYLAGTYMTWEPNSFTNMQTVITRPGQPSQRVVFKYEAGSQMATRFATTRHVAFGYHSAGFDVGLTQQAQDQVLAAVNWAAASIYVEAPEAPPPPPPPDDGPSPVTGDHFYATQAELDVWTSRMVNGPYRVLGDVSANSPGDWARINANAENFRSNPSQGRWVQPGTGYIGSGDPFPGEGGSGVTYDNVSRMVDAAFKGMLTDDADLKAKVKTELLWQAAEWSFSSLNHSRWNPDYHGAWPSPIFALTRFVQRWFHARDFLGRDYFTAGENDDLDRWFYGYANYVTHLIDKEINKSGRYPNRWNEDWSTWTARRGSVKYAWDGGQTIEHPHMVYNNRMASANVVSTVIAPYLQHYGYTAPTSGAPSYGFYSVADLVKHGWIWFNELLISTVFPNGVMGDFERGSASNSTLGRDYSIAPMGIMSEIADAHARIGDFRPYNLTTKMGYFGSDGTPTLSGFSAGKSLLFTSTFMEKYGDGSTYTDRTWSGNQLFAPTQVTDLVVARANLFYDDAWLKSAYMRTASGFPGYPSSPKSSGGWGGSNAWRGEQNHSVGLLFQYGQMENVDVYGLGG